MYSPEVTAQRLALMEKSQNCKLIRHSVAEVDEWVHRLAPFFNDDGSQKADLDAQSHAFIINERLLAKFDFQYWATRYAMCIRDGIAGGGLGRTVFWESQKIAMARIAAQEDHCWECKQKGWPVPGIKIAWHKARQLGATKMGRELTVHRITLWQHQRALAASVGDDMISELYMRDGITLSNLPAWLRPPTNRPKGDYQENVDELRYFVRMGSYINYQTARQSADLGVGRQFELSHLTECALWPYPSVLTNGYIPTIPQSIMTLALMESTAQGKRNWWCEWTESIRKGQQVGWIYIFVPWYAESRKYRLHPPDDWNPAPLTLKHAEMVEKTSPEWMLGKTVRLDREQLYWYESNRNSWAAKGDLNLFLANYASTPMESFQHTTPSVFSTEVIEELRLGVSKGEPYVIQIAENPKPAPGVAA